MDEWQKESEGEKMKPDGVSDDIFNDLVNALDKAIMLIYDMSIRKVAFPGDMMRRWENLVKYVRAKESEVEHDKCRECKHSTLKKAREALKECAEISSFDGLYRVASIAEDAIQDIDELEGSEWERLKRIGSYMSKVGI